MTNKNQIGFWIGEKGYTKYAETGPENFCRLALEHIQARIGFTFKYGTEAFPLSISCGEYTMHPDFIVSMPRTMTNGQLEKVVEVDGVHHFTNHQERRRRWRDSLIIKQGFDIVHVDARLCQKTYCQHLRAELAKALQTGSPVEIIYG